MLSIGYHIRAVLTKLLLGFLLQCNIRPVI